MEGTNLVLPCDEASDLEAQVQQAADGLLASLGIGNGGAAGAATPAAARAQVAPAPPEPAFASLTHQLSSGLRGLSLGEWLGQGAGGDA